MNRFDNGHGHMPPPHFLDPPIVATAAPNRHRPTLVGLVALAAMWCGSGLAAGLWLGVVGAIAWRVFQWLT